jgi:hypothetical protein
LNIRVALPFAPQTARVNEILEQIVVNEATGCWEWQGYRDKRGYSRIGYEGGRQMLHRLTLAWVGRPPQEGLVTDHLCRVHYCCNPAHLESVTDRTNVLRGAGLAAQRAAQTHCKRGHAFTEDNTYIIPSTGSRSCRTCGRMHGKATKQRQKERRRARWVPREDAKRIEDAFNDESPF